MDPNPILPATNEAVWGVVSLLVPLVILAAIVLLARYLRRLRRAAMEAAARAGAAEREVAALRTELHRESA